LVTDAGIEFLGRVGIDLYALMTGSSKRSSRQQPDQPIEWHQRATLLPILPCNLPTGSSYRLNNHPRR
jgi:hypothetical protein